MKQSKKIVFFGNESLATGLDSDPIVLSALVSAGYDVVALVVHERSSTSRNKKVVESVRFADKHNIPVYNPLDPREIVEQLSSLNVDIGILVAYGRIVPKGIIDLFPHGIINLHPSALPAYRGPTPIEQALLDGAEKTAVSIMSLVSDMDAGPVFSQVECDIKPEDTKSSLANTLHNVGKDELMRILPDILSGTKKASPQDETKASYCKLIKKEDGVLDFNKPAEQLSREVVAYTVWPKSKTTLGSIEATITKAHAVPTTHGTPGDIKVYGNKTLALSCKEGALAIDALIPSGKKEMATQEFLRGYRDKII